MVGFHQDMQNFAAQKLIFLRERSKQDQTGLDRSARSTLDFGAEGLKVSRSQGLKVSGSQDLRVSRSQGLKVSRS